MKIHLLAIGLTVLSLLLVDVATAAPEVSHEDIRDAILSLVSIFRDNSDKLERHEFRERQLGEQLKKAIAGLDKRYKNQDQNIEKLASLMLRFDERLKNFEMIVKQRDERERIQLQKSYDAIEGVQESLSTMMKEFQGPSKENNKAAYTVQGSDRQYIEALEVSLTSRMEELAAKIDQLQENSQAPPLGSIEIDDDLKKSIKEAERILVKFDRENEETPKTGVDVTSAMQEQGKTLNAILHSVTRACEEIDKLPTRGDLQEISNGTQSCLQEIKEELMAVNDQGVSKLKMEIEESFGSVNSAQEEVIKTVTELQTMGENLYSDVSKSYDQLLQEIKGLNDVEQVMIQTADNVLDTKRRIEYGVHQILLEVGDLVKIQSKNLNHTINQRFDDIEATILDNQTGALSNLSSKIETEISQVWRQIGIMYQQLTASADTLDRLQQQTDTYVNGSVKTMDSMEGKVGKITNRMTEVDENLNYLLGKLSLVTSEFNQIKSGLASALDNIRSSFLAVHNDLKDSGPGPRPIDNDVASILKESEPSS